MAAVGIIFDWENHDEVNALLKAWPKKIANKIKRSAARKASKVVQTEAKKNVPVDTGLLKKLIKVRKHPKLKRGQIGFHVTVSPSELMDKSNKRYPYYMAVEYGTKNMRATSFMKRSADAVRPRVNRLFLDEVRKGIDAVSNQ